MMRVRRKKRRCELPFAHAVKMGGEDGKPSITSTTEQECSTSGLIEIPERPLGTVDTVRLRIEAPLIPDDIEYLLAKEDWSGSTKGETVHRRGSVERLSPGASFWKRKHDGLRIIAHGRGVDVEVSVPRVLGLDNHEQSVVTDDAACVAIRACTTDLLPRTTGNAMGLGWEWYLIRLDLAQNFRERVAPIVELLRLLRHPRVRRLAQSYGDVGHSFYGTHRELIVYDRTHLAEARDGKSSLLRRRRGGKAREGARIEARWRGADALQNVACHLQGATCGLPFKVQDPDGLTRVATLWPDSHTLQRVLATEVASIMPPMLAPAASIEGNFLNYLGAWAVATHADLMPLVHERYTERHSLRRVMDKIAAIKIDTESLDLVERAFLPQRLPPNLWCSLRRQQFEMSAWSPNGSPWLEHAQCHPTGMATDGTSR